MIGHPVPSTPGPRSALPVIAYVAAAPHAPPRILNVRISQTRVHSGDVVSGAVETTSNVASVEARIESRLGVFSTSLRRSRYGHFELAYRVPSVPFYAHGTYTLRLLARNVDGKIAEHDLPFTIQ